MTDDLALKWLKKDEEMMMSAGFLKRHWTDAAVVMLAGILLGVIVHFRQDSRIVEYVGPAVAIVIDLLVGVFAVLAFYSLYLIPASIAEGVRYLMLRRHLGRKDAIVPAAAEFTLAALMFLYLSWIVSLATHLNIFMSAGIAFMAIITASVLLVLFVALAAFITLRISRGKDPPETRNGTDKS